jgi:hypothetical protein
MEMPHYYPDTLIDFVQNVKWFRVLLERLDKMAIIDKRSAI